MLELVGVAVGGFLGILGASGGIIAIPLLHSLVGIEFQEASMLSLIAIFFSTAVASLISSKDKLIENKTVLLVVSGAIGASFVGVCLSKVIPHIYTSVFFLGIALFICGKTFFPQKIKIEFSDSYGSSKKSLILIGIIGGFLTGLIGVGGGFIYVPLYKFALKMDMKKAVANSLLTIAITTFITILFRSYSEVISFEIVSVFTLFTTMGMVVGRFVSQKLNLVFVEKIFGFTVGFLSLYMVLIMVLENI